MVGEKRARKQAIAKILSFTTENMDKWIRERLHGTDPYFPTLTGHELNLGGFLSDAFRHIKNETFRDGFLEILGDLVAELKEFSPGDIEEQKDYIYELLTLCASIRSFEDKTDMIDLAETGTLKGFKVNDTDLHVVLLTTLASYRIGGHVDFWLKQMQDDFSIQCANAAFYALLDKRFSLEHLFGKIHIFLDRVKDHPQFDAAIESLYDDHEPEEIRIRFQSIQSNLSRDQKDAVDKAVQEAGYDPVFKNKTPVSRMHGYGFHTAPLRNVSAPKTPYGDDTTLEAKTAEIFGDMGFRIKKYNRTPEGYNDRLLVKKNNFRDGHEIWLCRCGGQKKKIGEPEVLDLLDSLETEKRNHIEFATPPSTFGALYISEKGFTSEAVQTAKNNNVVLRTFMQLLEEAGKR